MVRCISHMESEDIEYNIPLKLKPIAKTMQNGELKEAGISVFSHCYLTGLVARELLSRMSTEKRKLFPANAEIVSAIHDIGKINPLFQERIRRSISNPPYENNSCHGLENAKPILENQTGYHSGVSYITLVDNSKSIATIIGSHHGSLSSPEIDADSPVIGGCIWNQLRINTIHELEIMLNEKLPDKIPKNEIAITAGLTTVSDWISSGPQYAALIDDDILKINEKDIAKGVDQAGFITPIIRKGLSFEDVFPGFKPNATQTSLMNMASGNGVYVVEAQMGEGKTEAALYAAYQLLQNGNASGIYFAMPTQLTSNRIYDRFTPFLDRILDPSDRHKPLLLHSNSWMHSLIGEDCKPGYSWFDTRKRGLLAPFAVGTIDQALLASMNVRHFFVRLFGLANKVVILDEVHTYDSYTGTILENLIQCLVQLNCTVIILSATLSSSQKMQMLHLSSENSTDIQYPLITKYNGQDLEFASPACSQKRHVNVNYIEESDEKAIEEVKEKAMNGEQILWIENTVNHAQEIFKKLACWGKENNIEVALLHSRFTGEDRAKIEDKWVSIYGKAGMDQRPSSGRILIGTQVLEQSLDLDADFLVSRIAPSDMLLQRIGRLWRHRVIDPLRPKSASPTILILSPESELIRTNSKEALGDSGLVYSPYVLYRTACIWNGLSAINIPDDLRNIIENTYSDQLETDLSIMDIKNDLIDKKKALSRQANNSMADIGHEMNDSCNTRFNELPSCQVLLIRSIDCDKTGCITLIDGTRIDLSKERCSLERKRLTALALEKFSLQCSVQKAPPFEKTSILQYLRNFLFISDNEQEALRIGILGRNDEITSPNGNQNNKYIIRYNPLLGYQAIRRN